MKKVLTLAMIMISASSFAHLGGTPTLSTEQLQAGWNGKQGPQVTNVSGVKAHWSADKDGRVNGHGLPVCAALPVDEQEPNVNCVDYMPRH